MCILLQLSNQYFIYNMHYQTIPPPPKCMIMFHCINNIATRINWYYNTECSFVLTLMGDPYSESTSRLSIPLSSTMPGCNTVSSTCPPLQAIVNKRQETVNQPINSSHCHISSLEVYRGREQAISISYNGFALGNESNLEVSIDIRREIPFPLIVYYL